MDDNEVAINEWSGYIQEIDSFVERMDGRLLGVENVRQTEREGFTPEELVWVEAEGRAAGFYGYFWTGDQLNLSVGRGQFELPTPKGYFFNHRQALATSIERLHRHFVTEAELEKIRQGMAVLRQKMAAVEDGLLVRALGLRREVERLDHAYDQTRRDAFFNNNQRLSLLFVDPDAALGFFNASQALFAAADQLEQKIIEKDREYKAALRAITVELEQPAFTAIDPPPLDPRFNVTADGAFRALVGGPQGAIACRLTPADGVDIQGVLENSSERGVMLTRLRARSQDGQAMADVRILAIQPLVPEVDFIPLPTEDIPILEIGDDLQPNLILQPKIYGARATQPVPSRNVVLQGEFRGPGEVVVTFTAKKPPVGASSLQLPARVDQDKSNPWEISARIPNAPPGEYEIVVSVGGRESQPFDFEIIDPSTIRDSALRRIGERLREQALDIALGSDFLREVVGFIYSNTQKVGLARYILASKSNEFGRSFILYEAIFNDGWKDFTLTIKLGRVPRGVSDRLLAPGDPLFVAFNDEKFNLVKITRREDVYDVKIFSNLVEGGLAVVRFDKERDRIILTEFLGWDLRDTLGARLQYNQDKKSVEVEWVMVEETGKRATLGLETSTREPSLGIYQENQVQLPDGRSIDTLLEFRHLFKEGRTEGLIRLGGTQPLQENTVRYGFEVSGALEDGRLVEGLVNGQLTLPVPGGQLGLNAGVTRAAGAEDETYQANFSYTPALGDPDRLFTLNLGLERRGGETGINLGARYQLKNVTSLDLDFSVGANVSGRFDGSDMLVGAGVQAAVEGEFGPVEWGLNADGRLDILDGPRGDRDVFVRGIFGGRLETSVAEFTLQYFVVDGPGGTETGVQAGLELKGIARSGAKNVGRVTGQKIEDEFTWGDAPPPLPSLAEP
ncbi:MAG: hypothetical protein AB1791_05455 [Chloroflexota bacterium]